MALADIGPAVETPVRIRKQVLDLLFFVLHSKHHGILALEELGDSNANYGPRHEES